MAVFLTDNLTDTTGTALESHTADSGATWTKHGSTGAGMGMLISDANRVRLDGTTNSSPAIYYASAVPGSANYDVEGVLRVLSQANHMSGIAARMDTSANTMYHARWNRNNQRLELVKVVAGGHTVTDFVSRSAGSGTDITIKLSVSGTTLNVYDGGALSLGPRTDSAISAAGRAGFYMEKQAGTPSNTVQSHWDSIVATDDTAGGGGVPRHFMHYQRLRVA